MRVEKGGQKMPVFVHTQGIKLSMQRGEIKKCQNSVYVVVECPLTRKKLIVIQWRKTMMHK
jgi:hypothetical protein